MLMPCEMQRARMRYKFIVDGVGFSMKSKERFRLACCDCGLVHDMVLVSGRGVVGVAMKRNKRATTMRRKMAARPGGQG